MASAVSGSADSSNCLTWKGLVCDEVSGDIVLDCLSASPSAASSISHSYRPQNAPSLFPGQRISSLHHFDLSLNRFKGGFQQLRVLHLHSIELWADVVDVHVALHSVQHVDLSANLLYDDLSLSAENVSSIAYTLHFLNINVLNGPFFGGEYIKLVFGSSKCWIWAITPSQPSFPLLWFKINFQNNCYFISKYNKVN
ncbi:putative inactive receptor kinase [Arachis hypogaea]|nr:putative inactive receptor kinase [Arachis hypogaea]